jgi:hypothetical protein
MPITASLHHLPCLHLCLHSHFVTSRRLDPSHEDQVHRNQSSNHPQMYCQYAITRSSPLLSKTRLAHAIGSLKSREPFCKEWPANDRVRADITLVYPHPSPDSVDFAP